MADRLNVAAGDEVFVAEVEDGILITPYDETTRRAIESGRRIAKQYRNALRELAR
ncbi:MAG: AbrB/MazE/SpoVT family DNA-binding domain-containing protein [Chloroflexota bacterium]|nr:AbrB/MazE/SpoVT family DNA-binding domain-containing protein [Chloroflexota bacterium]